MLYRHRASETGAGEEGDRRAAAETALCGASSILGSRQIGAGPVKTNWGTDASEPVCPRCFSARLLGIQVAAGEVLRDRGASEPVGFCGTPQGAGWRSSSGVGGFCDTSQHAVAPVSGSRRPGCPDMRCLSGSAEVLF